MTTRPASSTSRTISIIKPVGQRAVERRALARRLETLNGKPIGFIDNIKPNAGLFIQHIEEMLRADHSGLTTHTVRKDRTAWRVKS
jgi:hypothetical protein